MSDVSDSPLNQAIEDLAQDLRKGGAPTRYHAREILVALGSMVLGAEEASQEAETDGIVKRIADATAEHDELWQTAIREELLLAGAEHTQAIDPRFLEHPRYDFGYTVAARTRLEARLRAAPLIGHEVPEDLLDRIAQADAELEPYLER